VGSGLKLEVSKVVEERNFAEPAGEFARDDFRKRHEACIRVGLHGQVALEGACTISNADPGAEHKGVAAVESDGWFEVDGSRRVRHVISDESPYLARQLSVF
jgi:hypothetical protein